jgi:hypothetical protein
MSKIDNLSNKTMKIGTVVGSNSSQRGQGNWKDYILLNNLFEELKLTSHEGDLVLDTFRRILQLFAELLLTVEYEDLILEPLYKYNVLTGESCCHVVYYGLYVYISVCNGI